MDETQASNSLPNPYAVTTDLTAREHNAAFQVSTSNYRFALVLLYSAIPLLIVAALFSLIEIESILWSGGIMLAYGVLLVFFTRSRSPLAWFHWFAWMCLIFPFIVFGLIFMNGWSPRQALRPVSTLICVVAVLNIGGLILGLVRHSKPLHLVREPLTTTETE